MHYNHTCLSYLEVVSFIRSKEESRHYTCLTADKAKVVAQFCVVLMLNPERVVPLKMLNSSHCLQLYIERKRDFPRMITQWCRYYGIGAGAWAASRTYSPDLSTNIVKFASYFLFLFHSRKYQFFIYQYPHVFDISCCNYVMYLIILITRFCSGLL
jgi:hypothetical protein